jgi:hypothetical protein
LGLKLRVGWRQVRLQARGKVAKHPARGPASQPGATPTSLPASQISNQPARQSLNKSAVQKPFKQLWLPDTVSLSLVLSISFYLFPSLSPPLSFSLPLCVGHIQEGETADGKPAIRRELAGNPSMWLTRQAAGEAWVLTTSNKHQPQAVASLSASHSLSLSPSLSLGKLPEGIVRQGGIQAGGLLNRGGGRRGVKADRQPAWRATMHPWLAAGRPAKHPARGRARPRALPAARGPAN